MFTVYREGFRVISKVAVTGYGGSCNTGASAFLRNSKCGSVGLWKYFSHCNSHSKICNMPLGSFQAIATNKIYLLKNPATPVNYQIHQDVTRSNFHTSSCLNSYDEDYQREEKRNANILILMCITLIVTVGTAYSFVDFEEYDRPTLEKS